MSKSKHSVRLTDAQVRAKIRSIFDYRSKTSYLTAGILTMSFLALTMLLATPPGFRKTSTRWGIALWTVNLVWTLMAAFGWKELPFEQLKRLPPKNRQQHLHSQAGWFHLWKAGYIQFVSAAMLVIGLGALSYCGTPAWSNALIVGGYFAIFILSFWQRRHILLVAVRGWSSGTPWGRFMLRLTTVGPVVGSLIGSGIALLLVRLHLLPVSAGVASAGLVAVAVAYMTVPTVIQAILVSRIHWQKEKEEHQHKDVSGLS